MLEATRRRFFLLSASRSVAVAKYLHDIFIGGYFKLKVVSGYLHNTRLSVKLCHKRQHKMTV